MGGAKRYYPAFLDLNGRRAVVVGSGAGAEKKALQLARYGADVTIVTDAPSPELVEAEGDGKLLIEERAYVRGDLAGAAIVFCVTDDSEVRIAVTQEARSVGCPLNVSDTPALSTFLVPGVVHREPLQIAVSTGGLSPELAKRVRRNLSAAYDEGWRGYADLVTETRSLAAGRLAEPGALAAFMDALLDADVLGRLRSGEALSAEMLYTEFEAFGVAAEPEDAEPVPAPEPAAAPEPAPEDGSGPEPEVAE